MKNFLIFLLLFQEIQSFPRQKKTVWQTDQKKTATPFIPELYGPMTGKSM